MCGATSAADITGICKAKVEVHDSAPNVYEGLLLDTDRLDGAGRTKLGASRTFRTAETAVEIHLRLHHVTEVSARAEDFVRAIGNAQLAGGAMVVEIPFSVRARRSDSLFALRCLFIKYSSQTAVKFALLCTESQRRSCEDGAGDKSSTTRIRSIVHRFASHLTIGETVFESTKLTMVYAVKAVNATACIDLSVFNVDAMGLAGPLTSVAVHAH